MSLMDISSFFGSSSSNWMSSFNFRDYSLIQSGSYQKLMRSYYNQLETGSSTSSTRSTTSTSDTSRSGKSDTGYNDPLRFNSADKISNLYQSEYTDSTGLTKMKNEANDLKTAAKKLDEGAFWETKGSNSGSSDTTAQITSAVKDFANAYNNVLDQSSKVNSTDVKQQTRAMTSLTRTLSKALSSIGINQDTAGKLTVDEDKLKSADKKSVEKLLSGTYSYAAQITKQASNISSAAVRSSSLYTSTGSLTGSMYGDYNYWT